MPESSSLKAKIEYAYMPPNGTAAWLYAGHNPKPTSLSPASSIRYISFHAVFAPLAVFLIVV
jgi:hypothetical protein